eukprot:SAG11_NODE_17861_length_507_cov_0.801471_1_plen_56_part_10
MSKLELENQQLANRLVATESDKARLFASVRIYRRTCTYLHVRSFIHILLDLRVCAR